MTRAEIFIQILSETTGEREAFIRDTVTAFRLAHPGGDWDRQLAPEKAEALMAALRQEKDSILNWLIQGAAGVHQRTGHA